LCFVVFLAGSVLPLISLVTALAVALIAIAVWALQKI